SCCCCSSSTSYCFSLVCGFIGVVFIPSSRGLRLSNWPRRVNLAESACAIKVGRRVVPKAPQQKGRASCPQRAEEKQSISGMTGALRTTRPTIPVKSSRCSKRVEPIETLCWKERRAHRAVGGGAYDEIC